MYLVVTNRRDRSMAGIGGSGAGGGGGEGRMMLICSGGMLTLPANSHR